MKNLRTPRALADCQFEVGYKGVELHAPPVPRSERIAGVLLATVIGILLTLALVHWWST